MISVDICILVGRGDENLKRYMESFEAMSEMPAKLIVVVDMNFRGEIPAMEFDVPVEIEVIPYRGRLRQPAMRNMALKASTSDFIWFMDDDVSIPRCSLENLTKVLNSFTGLNIGCFAGKIIEERSYDPRMLKFPVELHWFRGAIGYFGGDLSCFDSSRYKFLSSADGTQLPRVEFSQGTSMVFEKKSLVGVGGFNEQLGVDYASYEDSEPSFALARANKHTVYCPDFELIHHKMVRVNGASREKPTLPYHYSLIRNHGVSLLCNAYPSVTKAFIYQAGFSLAQAFRFVRAYRDSPPKVVAGIFVAFLAYVAGVFLGLKLFVSGRSYV